MSDKNESSKEWEAPTFFHKIGNLYETKYGWAVSYIQSFFLGENNDIGYGTYIQAKYGVFIGNGVQIGAHCAIYSYDSERDYKGAVHIEDNVLIGAHTIIFPNTIIKKNTKIKANSILDGGVYE